MSSPMENGARPDSQPDKHVADEENKSQNATIHRIQQYRDRVAEYQLLFAQNELSREITEAQQHRSYHQLVKGFLQLLKPYLMDESIPGSQFYWQGYSGNSPDPDDGILHLGEIVVEPPDAIRQPSKEEMAGALQAGDQQTIQRADPRNAVEEQKYDIVGLRDFASAEVEWIEEWEVMFGPEVTPYDLRQQIHDPMVDVRDRRHRNEPITVVRTVRVPRSIIDNAVTALENFVRDMGMDIDFEADPYMGEGEPGL